MQKKDLKAIDQSAPLQMPANLNFKRAAETAAAALEGAAQAKKQRLQAEQEASSLEAADVAAPAASAQQQAASIAIKRIADKLNKAPQEKAIVNKANLK